ncbi:iron ABC transporter permease [Rubellimicrobium sp. CFH 75288]|uniref:FecCD family ABC transporter permease n=1 Tax=Rubellimicrobium sp. CFH 75288 TaxID=2697034 RepID=UPI001412375E|nr:iron ABC transporter permease [Rubellimicrobium sp. CFH 75288]NAZ38281.1 iron chelate uptake ABC transporter family permease subunit [Rubellimicrobium sp. CFH 75288]
MTAHAATHAGPGGRRAAALAGAPLLLGLLVLVFLWHIAVGAKPIPLGTVLAALTAPEPGNFDHVVIRDLRLPRAVYAVAVGASLSVAGALIQGVTRNPLAEPGLLGLMAGASVAVVLWVALQGPGGSAALPLVAALGALGGAALVWGLAGAAPGGVQPLSLILAGAAVTAFLGAIVTLAHLLDEQSFQSLRVWLNGTLSGRSWEVFLWGLPWFAGGLALAFVLARQVTALAMGEEVAAGLGVDVARLKALALAAVVALTAASVALAGPLGFVGLVIPHAARLFVGADYRLIVPVSAVIGAIYLLGVDILARVALAPLEIATGLVTALAGGPVFVWLVRARL